MERLQTKPNKMEVKMNVMYAFVIGVYFESRIIYLGLRGRRADSLPTTYTFNKYFKAGVYVKWTAFDSSCSFLLLLTQERVPKIIITRACGDPLLVTSQA